MQCFYQKLESGMVYFLGLSTKIYFLSLLVGIWIKVHFPFNRELQKPVLQLIKDKKECWNFCRNQKNGVLSVFLVDLNPELLIVPVKETYL